MSNKYIISLTGLSVVCALLAPAWVVEVNPDALFFIGHASLGAILSAAAGGWLFWQSQKQLTSPAYAKYSRLAVIVALLGASGLLAVTLRVFLPDISSGYLAIPHIILVTLIVVELTKHLLFSK